MQIYPHPHKVTADEIDEQGHANNVEWVRWMQDAGVAHAEAFGYDEAWHQKLNAGWVAREHHIRYRLPAFEGEKIIVETHIAEMRKASILRKYRFLRDDKVLAEASTVWAFVDASTGRPIRINAEMRANWDKEVEEMSRADSDSQ